MNSIKVLIFSVFLLTGLGCSETFLSGAEPASDTSAVSGATDAPASGVKPAEATDGGVHDEDELNKADNEGQKPSDGSEDWGYVKPETKDNGDLYFRTEGLHPKVELQGHFLSGSYPEGMTIKVRLDAKLDVGDYPAAHPPVRLVLENEIGGELVESDFSKPFEVALLPVASTENSDFIVSFDAGLPQRVPTSNDKFVFASRQSKLALWLSDEPAQPFNPIGNVVIQYDPILKQHLFIGSDDGGYDSYFIAFYPADLADLQPTCFDPRRDAYASISAADMPGGRRGQLRVVGSGGGVGSQFVVCAASTDFVSDFSSPILTVDER